MTAGSERPAWLDEEPIIITLSPGGGENPGLEFVVEGDRIRFTLPRLETYTLVVIQL